MKSVGKTVHGLLMKALMFPPMWMSNDLPECEKTTSVFWYRWAGTSQVVDDWVPIVGSNRGKWYPDARKWSIAHEAGHLMRLGDHYDKDENGYGIPHPGWEGNIMGDVGGHVSIDNIREILRKNSHDNSAGQCGCN